jgi:hypothetical protein
MNNPFEYTLEPDERCEIRIYPGDLVLIQHNTSRSWVQAAKFVRHSAHTYFLVIAVEDELESLANWKVRCKL